ncbi:MAG: kelch repeat-containing protein [Thermoanaerobaculia bacterium]
MTDLARRLLSLLLLACLALPLGAVSVRRFSSPDVVGRPIAITATSTHLWVAMSSNFDYRAARVAPDGTWTDFNLRHMPMSIAAAPDGVVWVGCDIELARINLDDTIDFFPYAPTYSHPSDLVVGPDGALWFADEFADSVGRVIPGGAVQSFSLPYGSGPRAITVGPDGALWVARRGDGTVTRVATDGTMRDFPIGGEPSDIATGPDGALWVAFDQTRVARLHPAGSLRHVTTRYTPHGIVSGGGSLWAFTSGGYVQRIDPVAGGMEWHNIGSYQSGTMTGVWGPDSKLWFTAYWDAAIGRLNLSSAPTIDLEVRHRADPGVAFPNSPLTYEIDVVSRGQVPVPGPVLTMQLAWEETLQSLSTPPGWQCGAPAIDPSGGFSPRIRCTGPELPVGTAPFRFTLRTLFSHSHNSAITNRVWVDAAAEEADFILNQSMLWIPTDGVTISLTGREWFCAGGSTELTASAQTTHPPISYTWFLNDAPIPGASGATLSVSAAGAYKAIASDAVGATSSAVLQVVALATPPAAITAPVEFCNETLATVSTLDAGVGASYQWSVTNGSIVDGAGTREVRVLAERGAQTVGVSVNVTRGECTTPGVASATIAVKPCSTSGMKVVIPREGHTATLLSNGTVLLAGGVADHRTATELSAAEVFDPLTGGSQRVGELSRTRWLHTATLLRDGRVLIAGGASNGQSTRSAEVYDPSLGAFTQLADMRYAHSGHTATLLDDGRALIVGSASYRDAEYYLPETGKFVVAGQMQVTRYDHTATLLQDRRVLIIGGRNSVDFGGTTAAEIFDPATGLSTLTGRMRTGRFSHTSTLLPDGRVLVAGGWTRNGIVATAEIYNPVTGSFVDAPRMQFERAYHTATLLPNGTIAFLGGQYFGLPRAIEVFDPATMTFSIPAELETGRWQNTSTLLPDGRICVAAGMNIDYVSLDSIELIRLGNGGDFDEGEPLQSERGRHSATMLPDGNVLFVGGFNGSGQSLQTTEIFESTTRKFRHGSPIGTARGGHTATLLPDGRVVVAGGESNAATPLGEVELYDSVNSVFTSSPSLVTARTGHTATSLGRGDVLFIGGRGPAALASSELFDAILNQVTTGPSLAAAREGHTATLLPDGGVLVTGGSSGGAPLASAEVYEPVGMAFRTVGSMASGRMEHTASLLPNGKVLVAGGWSGIVALATTEIYDPATGAFVDGPPLFHARMQHLATVLPSGLVLIAGGIDGTAAIGEAELFDPASGTFVRAGTMNAPRSHHTATLLLDGTVLFAGGGNGQGASYNSSAEIYDPGLGFIETRRPQVSSVTRSLRDGEAVTASGSGFRGDSEASGGASGTANSSATNYPIVQLQRLDSDQIIRPLIDAAAGWSVDALKTAVIDHVPGGVYRMSVITNGIPSIQRLVTLDTSCRNPLEPPAPIDIVQTVCSGGGGASGATSIPLASFLGSATTAARCVAGGRALPPLVGGSEVNGATMFPLGTTVVTFRWEDAEGVVTTATSSVRVFSRGDLDADSRTNSVDLVVLANYLVRNVQEGRPPFTAPVLSADLNSDGLVNAIDLVVLANQLVGNIGCIEGPN